MDPIVRLNRVNKYTQLLLAHLASCFVFVQLLAVFMVSKIPRAASQLTLDLQVNWLRLCLLFCLSHVEALCVATCFMFAILIQLVKTELI